MIYKFFCPVCGYKTELKIPITEYQSTGHYCLDCGAELQRDPQDFGRNYTVNCDGFYSEHQSR